MGYIIRIVCILVTAFVLANSFSEDLIEYDLEKGKYLAACAVEIAKTYYEAKRVALVIANSTGVTESSLRLRHFLKNYGGLVTLRTGKVAAKDNAVIIKYFVLYVRNVDELKDVLESMNETFYDNTGLFIVVCTEECDVKATFEMLWGVYIVNSVLLESFEQGVVEVHGFYPFTSKWCEEIHPLLFNVWKSGYGFENNDVTLFPEKLNNLHNCPVKVSTFHQPPFMYLKNDEISEGIEGSLIKLFSEVMNFHIITLYPTDGYAWGFQNGTKWTGSLGQVVNGDANISICGAVPTIERFEALQMTFPYYSFDLVYTAPLADIAPTWKKLTYPFKPLAWISILIISLIVMIVMFSFKLECISGFWRKDLNMGRTKPNDLIILSWLIFTGQTLNRLPLKNFVRFMVFNWILLTFYIRNGYQSSLVGFLNVDTYEDNFNTLQEALEAGYSFGGGHSLSLFFTEMPELFEQYVEIAPSEFYKTLDKIAERKVDFLMVAQKESALEYLQHNNGIRWLHIIEEKVATCPATIFLRKFSPLAAPINSIITKIFESGIVDHYITQYSSEDFLKAIIKSTYERSPKMLTLHNCFGCFILMYLGSAIACLLFLLEIIKKRLFSY